MRQVVQCLKQRCLFLLLPLLLFQSTGVPWYIVQGVVYLDTDKVYALRANDGKVLWQSLFGSGFAMDQANGILYLLSSNMYALRSGTLNAFQASDGKWLRLSWLWRSSWLVLSNF